MTPKSTKQIIALAWERFNERLTTEEQDAMSEEEWIEEIDDILIGLFNEYGEWQELH
jgi:hypothetical protein